MNIAHEALDELIAMYKADRQEDHFDADRIAFKPP